MKLFLRKNIWWVSIGSGPERIRMSTGCEDKEQAAERGRQLAMVAMIRDDAERIETAAAMATSKRNRADTVEAGGHSLESCWKTHPHRSKTGKVLKPSSIEAARLCWFKFARYAAGRGVGYAGAVRPALVQDFLKSLLPRSAQVHAIYCRAMFDRLNVSPNPFAIKPPSPPVTHREPLTQEQIANLLAVVDRLAGQQNSADDAADFAVYIRFLLYTGLRMGDAATTRNDQIDWQNGVLERIMAKTNRSVKLPLHRDLMARLKRTNREFLFPSLARQYKRRQDVLTQRIKRVMITAGIVGEAHQYCAHCLRTTFASICAEHNVPLAVIQSWLGHTSPTVTRIYARIEDMRAKRAALERFPSLG